MVVGSYLILVIVLYAIGMIILGVIAAKKTKTLEDYAIAGKRVGPFFVALSIVATAYSVALYLGYPGWAYAWGYAPFWYFSAMGFTVPLGFYLFMKRFRFTMGKALSLPDYLGNRYNSRFMRAITAVVCFAISAYIASQYAGMAKMVDAYLNTGYTWGLIIVIFVASIYLVFGGTFGDIYTDVSQMIIMAFASVFIFVSGFFVIGGGLGKLHTMLLAQGPKYVALVNPESAIAYSPFVIVMSYVMAVLLWTWPHLSKLSMSLEREEDIKKCMYWIILFNFLAVFIMFGGLFARALAVEAKNIDYALPNYVIKYFPAPIAALIALAVFSAGMSTTDTEMIVISTAVSNDLYRKTFHPPGKWDDPQVKRRGVIIARATVVVLALFCFVILYLFPPWSVGLLIWIGTSALVGALCGPFLLGLYWRRGTPPAAIISTICGIVLYVVIMWYKLIRSPFVIAVACAAVATAIFIIVSLLTKPMPAEYVAQFFPDFRRKKQ